VTAADAKVYVSPDAASTVVTAVPAGATLDVMAKTDTWFQVRLPKDASGFERVGYVQKTKVKELAAATAAPAKSAAASAPPAAAPAVRSARPTAAVLDFDFGTIQNWWGGTWDIGKGISDLLVDELLNEGQLRLLERKQIQAVLGEQNLANSNRADVSASQAARMGKVLGAKMLVTGSVTKFGSEEKKVGGAAGGFASGMLGAGAKNTTATVALTVRVIDASTSEILASVKGEGKSNRRGLLLGGIAGGKFAGINMGSKDFKETILGEATEKAVKDAATRLTAQLAKDLP